MTTQKIYIQQEKKEAQLLTFQDFAIEQSFDQGNGFFKNVWLHIKDVKLHITNFINKYKIWKENEGSK